MTDEHSLRRVKPKEVDDPKQNPRACLPYSLPLDSMCMLAVLRVHGEIP